VERRENWADGLLLPKRGGLSIWKMRLGRLAIQAKSEEVFGLDLNGV
jgi:hypothetical protein